MAVDENLPYILIATAHKPLGFLCSMERSSWPCQTTKQFKLQTLKSFRFLFSILFYLSHNKFATVETFWGKANNFSAFFFYQEFSGRTSWNLPAVDLPPAGHPSYAPFAVGETRFCQLPVAHRAYD